MRGPLQVGRGVTLPLSELRWRFSRASGPGGQGVNTTDSRVELVFDVASSLALTQAQRERLLSGLGDRLVDGTLTVVASEHRSQLRNREAAAARLTLILRAALACAPPARRPTRATLGSQRRRLDRKARRGQTKSLRRPPAD